MQEELAGCGKSAGVWLPAWQASAESPPFLPPHLIRPTVRRLLRSPRFRVRVPIQTSSWYFFGVSDFLEFAQYVGVNLCKVTQHSQPACSQEGLSLQPAEQSAGCRGKAADDRQGGG
jgi:hypothetical protein